MNKVDQLFLKSALKNGLLDEAGVKAIAAEIQNDNGDASRHAVALDLLTQDQSNRLISPLMDDIGYRVSCFELLFWYGMGVFCVVGWLPLVLLLFHPKRGQVFGYWVCGFMTTLFVVVMFMKANGLDIAVLFRSM